MFKVFDKDLDGRLSFDEVREGYLFHFNKNLSRSELQKIFSNADLANTGFIEYSEFVLSAINHESILSEENLQKAFNLMDVDKSGSLSVAEIKSALMYTRGALSEEQLGNLVKAVDINGDGTIQFDEFVQFMR